MRKYASSVSRCRVHQRIKCIITQKGNRVGKIGKNQGKIGKNRASHDITPLLKAFSPEGVVAEITVTTILPSGNATESIFGSRIEVFIDGP